MWVLTIVTDTLSHTNSHTHTHTHTFCYQIVIGRHSHSVFKVTDKTGNFHQNNSNRAGETSWYGDPSDSQTCESDASVNALCLWRKKMTEMVGFGISGISKSTRGHSFWGYEKKVFEIKTLTLIFKNGMKTLAWNSDVNFIGLVLRRNINHMDNRNALVRNYRPDCH